MLILEICIRKVLMNLYMSIKDYYYFVHNLHQILSSTSGNFVPIQIHTNSQSLISCIAELPFFVA
jgi:hypothetical protein